MAGFPESPRVEDTFGELTALLHFMLPKSELYLGHLERPNCCLSNIRSHSDTKQNHNKAVEVGSVFGLISSTELVFLAHTAHSMSAF